MDLARLRNLDLNLLVAFQALVQERNVTRAAARIGLSQPAMSAALARLREVFEDDLMTRVGRGMELTPRAQSLGPRVGEILAKVEAAVARIEDFDPRATEREFAITTGDYEQYLLMPPLLRRLAREAPGIRVRTEMVSARTAGSLERAETDLWVLPVERRAPEYPYEILIQDHWVWVRCQSQPTPREPVSRDEVADVGIILHDPPREGFPEQSAMSVQAAFGRLPRIAALSPSLLVTLFMVRGTPYYGIVPFQLARRLGSQAEVRVVETPWVASTDRAMQWHPHSEADPCHRWFRRLLREVAAEIDAPVPSVP